MATSSSSTPSSSITTQSKLTDMRFHIAFAAVLTVAVISFLLLGPSFRSVVSFFWPLLLSTGIFLVAIIVLRLISPPSDDADKPGADLIEYVAGAVATTTPVENEGGESGRDATEEVDEAEEEQGKENSKNQWYGRCSGGTA